MKPNSETENRSTGAKKRGLRIPWLYWVALMVLLPGLLAVYYFLILDWHGRPYCHKQIMLGLRIWMQDEGKHTDGGGNAFPNVGGLGKASLDAIAQEMGRMDWADNYRYIPGLHEDDPRQLVLMYVSQPTRWTWHGSPPTVFQEKKWIVVPVDFESTPGHPGECSERITEEEFKNRLRETINFVRVNARPNWQAVVAEHTAFLDSLDHSAAKPR